ncbi:hypothetical protein ACFCV3_20290 [Kribbella sp. NPDC056345]|uniref:hypothetical protein n=1 Tax=Kribbella sp. NPDC056345 TaxID=3345789 RepID=UPI0035D854E9
MNDDDLQRRIRAQKPRPGWAGGAEGRAVLEGVLNSSVEEPSPPAGRRRGRLVAVAAVVVVVAVGGVAGFRMVRSGDDVSVRPSNGRTEVIQQGYAYDVTKLPVVMANTSTVVSGKVLAITARDESGGWTVVRVQVLQSIKGAAPAEVRMRQRGYVDESGTTHIIDKQQLVEVGGTYLFATNHEVAEDVYTVAPGPYGASRAADEAHLKELTDLYSAAAR